MSDAPIYPTAVPTKQFYVYHLIDPRTNLPYYVGKGKVRPRGKPRPCDHFRYVDRQKKTTQAARTNELFDLGLEPGYLILEDSYTAVDDEAYDREEVELDKYGLISEGKPSHQHHAWRSAT